MAGADGPPAFEPRDGGDPLDGFPPVLKQVRQAVSAGRATWHWLPFLDLNRVTDWVGAVDPDIGQQLIAMSGGDDNMAARNWLDGSATVTFAGITPGAGYSAEAVIR